MERAKSLHGRLWVKRDVGQNQHGQYFESWLRVLPLNKKLFEPSAPLPQMRLYGRTALQNNIFRRLRGVHNGKALWFFLGQSPVALTHPFVKIEAFGVKAPF